MDTTQTVYQPGQCFLDFSLKHADDCEEQSFVVGRNVQMEIWAPGVVMLEPEQLNTGHRALVVSCGIHGNETAPIEICQRLLQRVIEGEQILRHPVLLIFGNLDAIDKGRRFIETNLNRLFDTSVPLAPSDASGEAGRARQLELAVARFYQAFPGARRVHYDLHTAIRDSLHPKFAINPFGQNSEHALQRLKYLGVPTVLLAEQPTTTFSHSSFRRHGAEAFTVELGKVHPFGQNDPDDCARFEWGLSRLCQKTSWDFSEKESLPALYQVTRTLNKQFEDFHFTFPDDQANFTRFAEGDVIAIEGDIRHLAEAGEAMVFPNTKVPLGQRTLLLVRQLELDEF